MLWLKHVNEQSLLKAALHSTGSTEKGVGLVGDILYCLGIEAHLHALFESRRQLKQKLQLQWKKSQASRE